MLHASEQQPPRPRPRCRYRTNGAARAPAPIRTDATIAIGWASVRTAALARLQCDIVEVA